MKRLFFASFLFCVFLIAYCRAPPQQEERDGKKIRVTLSGDRESARGIFCAKADQPSTVLALRVLLFFPFSPFACAFSVHTRTHVCKEGERSRSYAPLKNVSFSVFHRRQTAWVRRREKQGRAESERDVAWPRTAPPLSQTPPNHTQTRVCTRLTYFPVFLFVSIICLNVSTLSKATLLTWEGFRFCWHGHVFVTSPRIPFCKRHKKEKTEKKKCAMWSESWCLPPIVWSLLFPIVVKKGRNKHTC